MELEGVYVPVVTPFADAGDIDHERLGAVVRYVVTSGARGVVACGSTGEFYALTDQERLDVFRTVKAAAPDGAQLVAGCNAGSTREIIGHMRAAHELGYSAVMLAPPYYSLPSEDELAAHFTAVARAVDIPIILYNFPARTGVEISEPVLEALAGIDNIVAVKESSGDVGRMHMILDRFEGAFTLLCGADDQALEYGAWGVRGWIAGIANCLPAQCSAVLEALDGGDLPAAREAMRRVLPFAQEAENGKFTQKVKYGCELACLCSAQVRAPLYELGDAERVRVSEAFARATAATHESSVRAD